MASTFGDRIDILKQRAGYGKLEMKIHIDQVYAHFQHESLDLHHPRGGQAKYLEAPLYAKADDMFQRMADELLNEESALPEAAIDGLKSLMDDVKEATPRLWGNLQNSQHGTVTDDGAVIYDHPAEVPRLSEEELKLLSDLITTPRERAIFKAWWRKKRGGL
jgi:hypothetical protein